MAAVTPDNTIPSLVVLLLAGLMVAFPVDLAAEEESPSGLRELTPEELERYEFEIDEEPAVVSDLSLGQRYVLSTQRREIEDLVARRLGILKLKGDKSDLDVLQRLVDRRAINGTDTRTWQGLGIVFGDILVTEHGLEWVSYEDDIGSSKALRWRNTENYVFPVTLFSKRIQFNEKINVPEVYNKISADIERFKAFEEDRPVFQSGG